MNSYVATTIAALFCTGTANAEPAHALRGLFCNTAEQLQTTIARAGYARTLAIATQVTNENEIVCTLATEIRFAITHPARTRLQVLNGESVVLYQAILVGIRVGKVTRPVSPPLNIHFLPFDPLPLEALEEGA
jgi:hypothetical protein